MVRRFEKKARTQSSYHVEEIEMLRSRKLSAQRGFAALKDAGAPKMLSARTTSSERKISGEPICPNGDFNRHALLLKLKICNVTEQISLLKIRNQRRTVPS